MVPATNIRKGSALRFRDDVYLVLDHKHVTPGKGRAFIQVVMRSLRTGRTMDHRFSASESVEIVPVHKRPLDYSYRDTSGFVFMDPETYEQTTLSEDMVDDAARYLTENMEVTVSYVDDAPVELELPPTVNLRVTQAPEGTRGDTATAATKSVELETGIRVNVPLFIKTGDVLRIDTRTGDYQGRA
jgi:elongation factor P